MKTRSTSVEAYKAVLEDGTVARENKRIYEKLYHRGPLTATECLTMIDQELKASGEKGVNFNTRTRFGELRDRGMLYEVRKRTCSVTGKTVLEWDVTCNLPQPPPKKIKKPSKEDRQKAILELMQLHKRCVEANMIKGFSRTLVNVLHWLNQ